MTNCEGRSYEKGMVVVAHPDDAEFGCSGTVAKWCHGGTDVVYVICTDGSKGSSDPGLTLEEVAETRRKEQQEAAAILGVKKVVFLGYEDSMLEPTMELRRDIAREIRKHRPDVLICQSPIRNLAAQGYIGHPDHLAAGEATFSAVYPAARDPLTFPELLQEGLDPHKVKELLVTGQECTDTWIDVSDQIDLAVSALMKHKSQVGNWDAGRHMKEWRGKVGESQSMAYAEAFKSFRFQVDEVKR